MRPTQRFFAAAALVLIGLGIGQVAALRGTDSSPDVAARPDIGVDPDANDQEPTPPSEEPEEEPTEAEVEATPTPEDDGEPAAQPSPTPDDDDDSGEQVASNGSGTGSQGAPPPTMPTTGAPANRWGALGTWMIAAGLMLLSAGLRRRRITQREMWAVVSSRVN